MRYGIVASYFIIMLFLITILIWLYYRKRTVDPSRRYKTFGPRFWADPVDSLVLSPIYILANYIMWRKFNSMLSGLAYITYTIAPLIYSVYMHSIFGQTIGKRISKVKVVDYKTESAISFKQAILRDSIPIAIYIAILVNLLIMVFTGKLNIDIFNNLKLANSTKNASLDMLVNISSWWYFAEIITMLTNKKRRAIHDFIARTVVVRVNVADESVSDELLTNKPIDDVAYADIPDDLSEASQCIMCGEAIPKEMDMCPLCGWTYKEVIKEI